MKVPISAALLAGSAIATPAIGPDNAFTRHMRKTAAFVQEVVNAPKTDAMIEKYKGKTSPLDFGTWSQKDLLAYKKRLAGNNAEGKDSVENRSLLERYAPPPNYCEYVHFEWGGEGEREFDGHTEERETYRADFMYGGRPHRMYQGLKTGACIPNYDDDNKLVGHYMIINAKYRENAYDEDDLFFRFFIFAPEDENCEVQIGYGHDSLDLYQNACVNHLHGPITKFFKGESDCYESRIGYGDEMMYGPPDLFNTILGPIFDMHPGDIVIGGDEGFSYANSYDDVPPVIDIPRSIILDIPPISGFGIDFSRNYYKYSCNTLKSMGIDVQQQRKGTRSCEPVDYAMWNFDYQGPQCFYADFIPFYVDIQCAGAGYKPPK